MVYFFCLLKSYIDDCGFEEAILLLTGFWERYLHLSTHPGILRLSSQFFYLCACFTFLVPCCGCGEFLRLYAFFQPSKTRVVQSPVGPLWGSAGERSLVASGWASWCALVSRKDCEVVSSSWVWSPRYFALSFSQPLVLQITWVIWVKKEMGLLCSVLHRWGSWYSHTLTFPCGRNHGLP